jgi:hypothetical protein
MQQAGISVHPVALTEYGINAIGSKQMVSQIDGIFSAMVVGEAIKAGFGETSRWDLANGYNNGDDGGLYSFDEPGIPRFSPRPAFYYLYYMQKYLGDILLKTKIKGTADIAAYPSSFSSGQKAAVLVNKGYYDQNLRINFQNGTIGDRYYYYTLIGGTDVPADITRPFSRKVYVNGNGPSLVAGGPLSYDTLKAYSSLVGSQVIIPVPPFSVTYLLVDSGNRQLTINDSISALITWNNPADILYGTRLSTIQLNATTSIPGKFTYNPPVNTILKADSDIILKTTFTPADTNYRTVSKSVRINVKKISPILTWNDPADLALGNALSVTQLNAKANIPGSFHYDPPSGTFLDTGRNQVIKATFLPNDSLDYFSISKTVLINVYDATGVSGISSESLKLYPVPTSDWIIIKDFQATMGTSIINLRIYSCQGNLLSEEQFAGIENSHEVDLRSLVPGIYLLQLNSEKGIICRRFLKL